LNVRNDDEEGITEGITEGIAIYLAPREDFPPLYQMATIYRAAHGSYRSQPTTTYIAIRAYNNDIFTYTPAFVPPTLYTGSLGPVTGATSTTCPQGRLLTETGKKLYPGVNPGVSTYMVSVYDAQNDLTGFIDPNSSAFVPQNTDRPYYIASPGSNSVDPYPDRAPPVYTRGNIFGQSNLDISGNAHFYSSLTIENGLTVTGGESNYGIATFYGNLNVNSTLTVSTLNISTGKLFVPTTGRPSAGVSSMVSATPIGSYKYLKINPVASYSTSQVFFTYTGQNNASTLSVEAIGTGEFTIVSANGSDGGSVNWFIVN